jgi:hypothetical protein
MAVDYLKDYLGIDPTDYSAMESTIAGVPPVGQSIIPNMGVPATPQPRMIDATPIPFSPMPMQDFGSQITGLEEQISKLMEQMGVLEAEKNDALQQQDVMRAELAQAQQDALTEQASEFEGVKTNLEQQIADLNAQIGSIQTPTETPIGRQGSVAGPPERPPVAGGTALREMDKPIPLEDFGFGPGIRRSEDFFRPEELRRINSIKQIGGKVPNTPSRQILGKDAQGNVILGDIIEPIKPPPFIQQLKPPSIERPLERLPLRPRRQDFMSINRLGRDAMDISPPMPSPVAPIPPAIPPMTPPMTPRPRPRPVPMPQPMTPSMPMPQPMAPTIRPDMTMMGGARGGFSGAIRPMMMRAGGGGISKAIVDLQSRLK